MSNPFVIITLGPTGAGKSKLVEKTIKDCGLAERAGPLETFPVFRVDDLVTQRQEYKDAVQDLKDLPKLSTISTPRGYETIVDLSEEDVNTYTEAYDKIMKIIGNAYMDSRKKPGCYSPTDEAILRPDHTADNNKFYDIQFIVQKKKIKKTENEIEDLKTRLPIQETKEKKEDILKKIKEEEDELKNLNKKLKTLEKKYADERTIPVPDLSNYNCNDINDFKILRAISKGISFSFEITGQTYPKHYLSWFNNAKEFYSETLNYDIYISGVFVPYRALLTRNLSRYQQELEKFKSNKTLPAPRLPELTDIMHNNILKIIDNIKLMHTKMTGKNEEKITRMLLYSNNKELLCEFDSENMRTKPEFDDALNRLYNTTTQNVQQAAKTIVLQDIASPLNSSIPRFGYPNGYRIGGRRRTSKTYKQRRRTQKKRNNKRNYNTKKTRNKRRKW